MPTDDRSDALPAVATAGALPRNRLLRLLPDAERALLVPHLDRVALEPMRTIAEPGGMIPHACFPESGVISVVTRLEDGSLIENGTVGPEGMAGIQLLLGVDWTPSLITGQVPGHALRLDADIFRSLLPTMPGLQALLHRYAVYFLAQVSQSLACNSAHSVHQRCARWMLMTHDRVESDEFVITHEVLAQMLAVRRAGVSEAAGALQQAGLIQYSRGRVRVLDRAGLERESCACYHVVRAHRDALVGPLDD